MKKRTFISLSTVVLFLTFGMFALSCKKEDPQQVEESLIVGEWALYGVSVTLDGNITPIPSGIVMDLTFRSDGTGFIFEVDEEGEDGEAFHWSLSSDGSRLTFSYEDEDAIANVLELAPANLALQEAGEDADERVLHFQLK